MKKVYLSHMESPIGELIISSSKEGLCGIWIEEDSNMRIWLNKYFDIVEECSEYNINIINQLQNYFKGELKRFKVPFHLLGTEFQKLIWKEFLQIPYGSTASYKDIAVRIGKPAGSRSVGSAAGANRIPVVIPCHRIIGSNGSLTGFTGGIQKKVKLLELEGHTVKDGKIRAKGRD